MRKVLFVLLIVGLVLLLIPQSRLKANIIKGGTGDRITGYAPADTLIDSLNVQIFIPLKIGLYVGNDVEFDLDAAGYPPASFPHYYDPTSPSGTPYEEIQVFSNSNVLTWYLDAMGTDFDASIPITQLEWSAAGAGSYTAFASSGTYDNHTSGGNTSGWADENEDYRFKCEADDPAGTYNTYLFYRLYAK